MCDVRAYDNLSRALGAAVLHEEYRTNFLKTQVDLLMHISEEVDTIDELSSMCGRIIINIIDMTIVLVEKAVENSALANVLKQVLCR